MRKFPSGGPLRPPGPAALVFALCLGSCGLFEPLFVQELVLEPPPLPAVWAGLELEGWDLEWRDGSELLRSGSMEAGARATLSLARGKPQAILARPRARGLDLRPAGFLYPWDCGPAAGALFGPVPAPLSFASGYAAEVWGRLEALGVDPAVYPLAKLRQAWSSRGGDPWALPPWKAASRLQDGSFRASLFPAAKVPLALPPGAWLPESPFCPMTRTAEGGMVARLSEGCFRFYGEEGSLEVRVEVGETSLLVRDRAAEGRPGPPAPEAWPEGGG